MIDSTATTAARTRSPDAGLDHVWRLKLLYLARPRLISNLLALVALFSIGFV
ncbi:MAG TPA: hypothetical protein VGN43_20335 [Steroidobacteraceae bacterium]|jgi:hypothetical protein|nr:hypothetical protein [Steroidobacteraceae bacterium]